MDAKVTVESNKSNELRTKKCAKFNLRNLRISLKYRPEILNLILRMRQCVRKKNSLLKKMKRELELLKFNERSKHEDVGSNSSQPTQVDKKEKKCITLKNSSTQTKNNVSSDIKETDKNKTEKSPDTGTRDAGWDFAKGDEMGKSIADQVKEAAQSALQQTGMVYVESAGMYYDYKTGYYYNTELGLYYHTDTGCYYTYSDDKKEFAFHSYPDRNAVAANASLAAHEKRKARKHRKDNEDDASKPKRRKKEKKEKKKETSRESIKKKKINNVRPQSEVDIKPQSEVDVKTQSEVDIKPQSEVDVKTQNEVDVKPQSEVDTKSIENDTNNATEHKQTENGKEDLEDGECSDTGSEKSDGEVSEVDEESDASTSTASDDDTVAKHHPPCMRVIVRETSLPKLKVGTLFLITKDGGTLGREGDHHTIVIRDTNVSRNHLEIRYDMDKRLYVVTDLGSKNGTLLNGVQMCESQEVSRPMEVVHGSTIQLGETKLLCHIHPGNDTCGHCEPGLIIETLEKEKVAYTRTCSVQKQYQLELARLKNKYAPEPLMIEEGTYNDRARARREAVGSSHHAEKTQSTDLDTSIAPENKGFKLLEKMGWSKGEGLGKDNQGDTEPVPLVSNEGKAGLGTPGSVAAPLTIPLPKNRNRIGGATLRLAAKSKLLQPPAKVFQDPLEDDDDE